MLANLGPQVFSASELRGALCIFLKFLSVSGFFFEVCSSLLAIVWSWS
jgi:hypothetical protein